MSIGNALLLGAAQAFKNLRELMGQVQNATDVVVTVFQDDATGDYYVQAHSCGKPL